MGLSRCFAYGMVVMAIALSQYACTDTKEWPEVDIDFLRPTEHAYFKVPASIDVSLDISSGKAIQFVRINVHDSQHNSITEDTYFYPEEQQISIETELHIPKLPDSQPGPYHIHVLVDDGENSSHGILKIQLEDAELFYDGFYVFSQPEDNTMAVHVYSEESILTESQELAGKYLSSKHDAKSDQLMVLSEDPGKLYALRASDFNELWSRQADMPIPTYNGLLWTSETVYLGTGNGRLIGLDPGDGILKMSTPYLEDSTGLTMGISGNFIVGDFMSRKGGKHSWHTFYQGTGDRFQKHAVPGPAIAFFPIKNQEALIVFSNWEGRGNVSEYDIHTNTSGLIYQSDSSFTKTIQLDEEHFFVSTGYEVFLFDRSTGFAQEIIQLQKKIVDVALETDQNRLYLLSAESLFIYNVSNYQLVSNVEPLEQASGICLRYRYAIDTGKDGETD